MNSPESQPFEEAPTPERATTFRLNPEFDRTQLKPGDILMDLTGTDPEQQRWEVIEVTPKGANQVETSLVTIDTRPEIVDLNLRYLIPALEEVVHRVYTHHHPSGPLSVGSAIVDDEAVIPQQVASEMKAYEDDLLAGFSRDEKPGGVWAHHDRDHLATGHYALRPDRTMIASEKQRIDSLLAELKKHGLETISSITGQLIHEGVAAPYYRRFIQTEAANWLNRYLEKAEQFYDGTLPTAKLIQESSRAQSFVTEGYQSAPPIRAKLISEGILNPRDRMATSSFDQPRLERQKISKRLAKAKQNSLNWIKEIKRRFTEIEGATPPEQYGQIPPEARPPRDEEPPVIDRKDPQLPVVPVVRPIAPPPSPRPEATPIDSEQDEDLILTRLPERPREPEPIETKIDLDSLPADMKAIEDLPTAEKDRLFDQLKKAAEGGVVVHAGEKRTDCSDLDGNMAVYLLGKVGIITRNTTVHYWSHNKIATDLPKHPEIRLVLDISPNPANISSITTGDMDREEKKRQLDERAAQLKFRSGTASENIPGRGDDEPGRMFFEHHTSSVTPESRSTTLKVYAYLRALGRVATPDDPDPQRADEGRRLWNVVSFVNAQDLRNYYSDGERFDIEATAMNAFGWLQAPQTDRRGGLRRNFKDPNRRYWWGEYNTRLRDVHRETGYRRELVKMMEETGADPTIQLTFDQMRSFGINNPELVVAKIKEGIGRARRIIERLRAENIIQRIDGMEVYFDIRNSGGTTDKEKEGELYGEGVDYSDILMSENIANRIVLGVDGSGTIKSMVAFARDKKMRDKIMRSVSLALAKGGEPIRNFILYRR